MIDDEGQVYERGLDGQYQPAEGLLGPKQAGVKRNLLGQPVAARDIFGSQKTAADGSPLYVAREAPGIPYPVAIIIVIGVLLVALRPLVYPIAAVAIAGLVLLDLRRRRLSYWTLLWVQAIVFGAAVVGGSHPEGFVIVTYLLLVAAYAAAGAAVGLVVATWRDVPIWTLLTFPALAAGWVLLGFASARVVDVSWENVSFAIALLVLLVVSGVGTYLVAKGPAPSRRS